MRIIRAREKTNKLDNAIIYDTDFIFRNYRHLLITNETEFNEEEEDSQNNTGKRRESSGRDG